MRMRTRRSRSRCRRSRPGRSDPPGRCSDSESAMSARSAGRRGHRRSTVGLRCRGGTLSSSRAPRTDTPESPFRDGRSLGVADPTAVPSRRRRADRRRGTPGRCVTPVLDLSQRHRTDQQPGSRRGRDRCGGRRYPQGGGRRPGGGRRSRGSDRRGASTSGASVVRSRGGRRGWSDVAGAEVVGASGARARGFPAGCCCG